MGIKKNLFILITTLILLSPMSVGATTNTEISSTSSEKEEFLTKDINKLSLNKGLPKTMTDFDPDFDWNLLNENDNIDLTKFEEVNETRPVPLSGGIFDTSSREYFLQFGQFNTYEGMHYQYPTANEPGKFLGRQAESLYVEVDNSKLNTVTNSRLLNPSIFGVKRQEVDSQPVVGVFGYSNNASAGGFDIGEYDEVNDKINVSKSDLPVMDTIQKLYIKKNEMVAYGYVGMGATKNVDIDKSSASYYMPVRVHVYVHDYFSGKIRYDVTLLNQQENAVNYSMLYSVSLSIAGEQLNTELYSNGLDGYWAHQGVVSIDSVPSDIYFYTDNDGIYGGAFGPTARAQGTQGSSTLYTRWLKTNDLINAIHPYENLSANIIDKGQKYSLNGRPGFYLRYDPLKIQSGETGTATLDMSINEINRTPSLTVNYLDDEGNKLANSTVKDYMYQDVYKVDPIDIEGYEFKRLADDSAPSSGTIMGDISVTFIYEKIKKAPIKIRYVDELNNEINPTKELSVLIGDKYDEAPVSISGYSHIRTDGEPSGTVESPDLIEITFMYTSNKSFELKENVTQMDGSSAEKVWLDDSLIYTIDINNLRPTNNLNTTYELLELKTKISDSLTDIKDFKFIDESNNIVGTVNYDETARILSAVLDEKNIVTQETKLYLTYSAKVKNNEQIGTLIKAVTTATAKYSNGFSSNEIESNEVISEIISGNLEFKHAPELLDFGNHKVSSANEEYDIIDTAELIVRDLRGVGNSWELRGKVSEGIESSNVLNNLYFIENGTEYFMGNQTDVIIKRHKTVDGQSVEIPIKKDANNRLALKVRAGSASVGNLSGSITWSLADVPGN